MLRKLIINNVGVLRAFRTPSSPTLERLTAFYARNGRGKTTLTAVLRAARDGDAATVMGRRSLGNSAVDPEIVLVRDSGVVQFTGQQWSSRNAPIEVFDTAFIADNIYAGEVTDLSHDRGLFSVIIGPEGVRLAKQLEFFVGEVKRTTARLKEAEAALAEDVPNDLKLDEFFALDPKADFKAKLEEAEKRLRAVQQADRVEALKPLEELTAPAVPGDIQAVLASTVADIDASARQKLLEHFQRFRLGRQGEQWVRFGLEHVHDDSCPFCGRSEVDESGLVSVYGQIFGDTSLR